MKIRATTIPMKRERNYGPFQKPMWNCIKTFLSKELSIRFSIFSNCRLLYTIRTELGHERYVCIDVLNSTWTTWSASLEPTLFILEKEIRILSWWDIFQLIYLLCHFKFLFIQALTIVWDNSICEPIYLNVGFIFTVLKFLSLANKVFEYMKRLPARQF